MSFFLVRLDRDDEGKLIETSLPDYGPYEKGADAAREAKDVAVMLGVKVMPRRIAQAMDWRARQRERMDGGQLLRLPKAWDLPPIEDHFAHLPSSDPTKIAFTENDALGVIDRVTIVNPGRYITRFYPEVSDADRRRLIASIDPSGEILFAWTQEEIEHVYRTGPASCMGEEFAHKFTNLPVWPTAVYAAGDLAIAYTMNNRGSIQSRALCWPEKKLFGRCYGDEARMKAALQAEGYTAIWESKTRWNTFEGAKLLKIPVEGTDKFVVPYFDNCNTAVDCGDHWMMASDPAPGTKVIVGGQRGQSEMYRICPKLRDARMDSSFYHVEGVNEEWSREACQKYAGRCDATGEWWPNEMLRHLAGGQRWSKKYFDENGGLCEISGRLYPKTELVVHKGRMTHTRIANPDSPHIAPAFEPLNIQAA